ncbi:hypothetical protein C2S51_036178 [Perilla frutescens var. frutescens]|nr:hypothetical protein C2S51_036178 [Perilla frutescens var. frutescens]
MGESFTVQISSNLVRKLVEDGEKVKKKTRKPKPRISQEPQAKPKPLSDDSPAIGWPVQPPLYPHRTLNPELEGVRSVLEESEKVVERLQKQEVTQRAKDLHDKEFRLPTRKPMPCLDQKDACLNCYKEHIKDPLKCAQLVKGFADCVSTAAN